MKVPDQTPEIKAARNGPKGCLNKSGVCMARFPRTLYPETIVDKDDGHISMKKHESMMNTFTPVLTYLLRCNTDVTSLLSGTSIKAVISYVADYVTKPTLKTHQIFSSAYDIFDRNSELLGGDVKAKDVARKLILQIVNSLTSKLEIGSPMAALYLLENPDHYTSHEFVPFWWRSYVSEVRRAWEGDDNEHPSSSLDTLVADNSDLADSTQVTSHNDDDNDLVKDKKTITEGGGDKKIDQPDTKFESNAIEPDNVIINQIDGNYTASSSIDDYKFRPEKYKDMSLYNWIQCYKKKKRSKKDI